MSLSPQGRRLSADVSTTTPCQKCATPTSWGSADLAATVCLDCLGNFEQWADAHPGTPFAEWWKPERPTFAPLNVTGWTNEELETQTMLDDEVAQRYADELAAWENR